MSALFLYIFFSHFVMRFSHCVYYRKQRVATMAVIVAVDVADGVVDDDG